MNIILDKRQTGKTTKLIKCAAESGAVILVRNKVDVYYTKQLAEKLFKNYEISIIPEIGDVNDWLKGVYRGTSLYKSAYKNGVLIDDIDMIIDEMFPVKMVSMSSDYNTILSDGNFAHQECDCNDLSL